MAYGDLRGYIDRLQEEGELQPINEEVDWNLEVGAIIRRSFDLKAPAPFFEKIKGYPEGFRILGAPLGRSNKPGNPYARIAVSMGMKVNSSYQDIVETYLNRKKNLIKPILVKDGPCKENVHVGEDIDLYEFPAPLLHQGDGGRYISTWHIVATKDPDSDWVNWGMYRQMISNKNTLTGFLLTHDIGTLYFGKYEPRKIPMEFAVALGTEPLTPIVGAIPIAPGISEMDVIGGIREEPLQLVKCETVDLAVPATSEIVFEGVVPPHERLDEGPFGEYTGFQAGKMSPKPVYKVRAITHRNDPILPVSCVGPFDDCANLASVFYSSEIFAELRGKHHLPVRGVYCPPECATHMIIVSSKIPYANYANQIANLIWSVKSRAEQHPHVVVVEDDVDPSNMDQVLHAMCTVCHPDRGIIKQPRGIGHGILPYLNEHEQRFCLGAQVLFDCTWPKDWAEDQIPPRVTFEGLWPKNIQERVLEKWKKYGYSENT